MKEKKVSMNVGVGSEGQYEFGLEYDFNIVEQSSATVIQFYWEASWNKNVTQRFL